MTENTSFKNIFCCDSNAVSRLMFLPKIASILLLLFLLTLPATATSYKNAIEISPYNLVFTKVKINGRDTLALIDSGSFRTIQLSSTLTQELKIPLTETTEIAKRYGGKEFYLKSGQINNFSIRNYEKRNVEINFIEGDIENISKQVNTDFQIILGWGFLSQFSYSDRLQKSLDAV